jgi:hypothetical protein
MEVFPADSQSGTEGRPGWFDEHRIEILLQDPFVQHRIARYSSTRPPTFQESMQRFAATAPGILSLPVIAAHRIVPLLSSNKINWKDERHFNLPIGRAIVAALCSFESRGQQLIDFDQRADGCTLLAKMAFKLLSGPGELAVDLAKESGGSVVNVGVRIPGLRSNQNPRSVRKTIDALYSDIVHIASLDQHL